MTDHPRKGKEARVGDRFGLNGFIVDVREPEPGSFHALVFNPKSGTFRWAPLSSGVHIPIDSPEESAALRADLARLKAAEEAPNTIDMSKGGAS